MGKTVIPGGLKFIGDNKRFWKQKILCNKQENYYLAFPSAIGGHFSNLVTIHQIFYIKALNP